MPGYAIQQQNEDQSTLLASQFRLLYNPSHAFADAINMISMFPGLRGFWPGSAVGDAGQMNDLSGNGLHLTNNSNSLFKSDNLIPHTEYDGAADYHFHADAAAFDILGTEAFIDTAIQGITIGCWIRPADIGKAPNQYIMAKRGGGGGDSYSILSPGSASTGRLRLTETGTLTVTEITSDVIFTDDTWGFLCGVWDNNTDTVKIWVNGTVKTAAATISALVNSTAQFRIGDEGGTQFYEGDVSLAFLCASALPDSFVSTFFQMTAPLFDVTI